MLETKALLNYSLAGIFIIAPLSNLQRPAFLKKEFSPVDEAHESFEKTNFSTTLPARCGHLRALYAQS